MTSTGTSRPKGAYHHGNLREALIDAGIELAREGGPDAIVVREASRRVGVSHNAAYRHFPDRESLLIAVGDRCMAALAALMQRLIGEVDPQDTSLRAARDRLRAVGTAYTDFATGEPGLFRTGFAAARAQAAAPVPEADPQGPPGPLTILGGVLDGLDLAGGVAPGARDCAEHVAWAGVHGFSLLSIDGPFGAMTQAEREAAREQLFETIEQGLGVPRERASRARRRG